MSSSSSSKSSLGQRVGGRRDKSLYSVEDDVLLLREIMRSKPFSAGQGEIMKAWDAAAARINACEAFERKIPTDRGPGKVVSFRFYYLLDMRRHERSLHVTNRDVNTAHKEREDLLDGLLELTQRQAAVHSSAEPSTVKDHVYILREVVDRPPMLLARNKVTSAWEAIARKMRSIPDFSKPQVTGEIVRRLVRQLIAIRQSQLQANRTLSDVDDLHREREQLLDECIRRIDDRGKERAILNLKAQSDQKQEKPKQSASKQALEPCVDNGPESESASSSDASGAESNERQSRRNATAVRPLPQPNEANRSPKKQKLDDRAVEMMKLRLNAEARLREHELRVREQRRVQDQRRMELEDRQAGLVQARQELAAEHNAQVQVAKAVAEGISTGIAAILKP
ncbi:hypothetical protein P43SY_004250 [Pythium insidiosum]|uniref:Myb-like domain-containing protein n=1 Tax=Pythium insidiosum TaxID=114742 RepID=A0AAD5Q4P4_PYTIN|nr:hypothetical protein P43SY_004250 [Pythium insidiosum]